MHIVYISREYPPSHRGGGIASYLKIMAEGFAAKGHQVTVIAASDDTRIESDEIINSVRIIRLAGGDFCIKASEPDSGIIEKFRFIYRFHFYRKKIRDAVSKLDNVDIIEVAEYGAEGLYLNNLNIPIVYRLHTPALLDHKNFSLQRLNFSNLLYYYSGKKELQILRDNGIYITSCSTSLKEWVGKYIGLNTTGIKVIYNPLQNDFLKDTLYDDKRIKCDTVFFAGTVCDWKGAGDLAEACQALNERGLNITLKMAGKTGNYGKALKEKYKSASWLKILGKLPQKELKTLYSSSAVVCLPSWWENMPMVCIEAMAQGAIVIGSNSGGMSEIIEDGQSGFLLPPKQPDLWANKILKIIQMTTEQRLKISNEAKQRISNVFSLNKIMDQTYNYYQFVISDYKR